MMLHTLDCDMPGWEAVNAGGEEEEDGDGWGDGPRGFNGGGFGGWPTRSGPSQDAYSDVWHSPTGVSQLYLLSAMVNGDTLIPDVQELTSGDTPLTTKENDDECLHRGQDDHQRCAR